MFNWFKRKTKKSNTRIGPEKTSEEDLKGLVIASIKYVVGIDGTIYVEFFWDSENQEDANENFSSLFCQINSGDLLESTVGFIEETLRGEGQEDEFARFFSNVLDEQKARIEPLLSSIGMGGKSDDEVVVKPTDVAQSMFKGNET